MRTIVVKEDQSIMDIALQEYGSVQVDTKNDENRVRYTCCTPVKSTKNIV